MGPQGRGASALPGVRVRLIEGADHMLTEQHARLKLG